MQRSARLIVSVLLAVWVTGCASGPTKPALVPAEPARRQPPVEPLREHAPPAAVDQPRQTLSICSFNIQFLGHSTQRKHAVLADVVKNFDIVVIQELVAPPYPMNFPDGKPVKPDPQSQAFFDAMKARGFAYQLSEEDTGTGDKIHSNGSNTEWFVVFYKPQQVAMATDLPGGFLADDRSNHDDYERVPYAFAFRTPGGTLDFVLISVHLRPEAGPAPRARRKHELASIAGWVQGHRQFEQDFIILGDMNIENQAELADDLPASFTSLNADCVSTNTSAQGKPYDHVMFQPQSTPEIDATFGFQVIDLVEAVRPTWTAADGAFPGDPYVHDKFRACYSDHRPVFFQMAIPDRDDDPNP